MPKSVQGVLAFVLAFVLAQTQVRRGLCRVCSTFPYVTREKTNATTKKINRLAYRVCQHTLHTLHRPRTPTPREFSHPAQLTAHPAHPLFY